MRLTLWEAMLSQTTNDSCFDVQVLVYSKPFRKNGQKNSLPLNPSSISRRGWCCLSKTGHLKHHPLTAWPLGPSVFSPPRNSTTKVWNSWRGYWQDSILVIPSVTFFGMVKLSDLFKRLSDLQLGDKKATAWITWMMFSLKAPSCSESSVRFFEEGTT